MLTSLEPAHLTIGLADFSGHFLALQSQHGFWWRFFHNFFKHHKGKGNNYFFIKRGLDGGANGCFMRFNSLEVVEIGSFPRHTS